MPIASLSAATRSSVASAVADTAILTASPDRVAVTIYNESTAVLFVGYGSTPVTTSNYSVQIPASGYLELPTSFVGCAIRGYWASANGAARVTVG